MTAVAHVDVGGRPGCRATVPSFSVLLLAKGSLGGFPDTLGYDHLTVVAGEEPVLRADTIDEFSALGSWLDDSEYVIGIGPPVAARSWASLLWSCWPLLAMLLLPAVVGTAIGRVLTWRYGSVGEPLR